MGLTSNIDGVLILVVVEDVLVQAKAKAKVDTPEVLILVVVEDVLVQIMKITVKGGGALS